MKKFVGRTEYLDDLESLWRKRSASLVACRGRRRIGKSTLFREFARQTADRYIEIEGLAPTKKMTDADQRRGFAESLAAQTDAEDSTPSNWLNAFKRLNAVIDDTKRTVVVLDEISWMGGYDDMFPGTLRKAWETYFNRHPNLVLVLCGSVSAWIRENLLDNTGFAGRFSRDYVLGELKLRECAAFWGEAAARVDPRDMLDVLSVTGGVPRYLEEIDPGLSAAENIRRTCFHSSGTLFKDFDAIFNPLFGSTNESKKAILSALCGEPLSGVEISRRLGDARNGHVNERLRELKEGGFVTDDPGLNPETGRAARVSKYRLKDNYTRFYLKYLAPHKREIEQGVYNFVSVENLPEWDAVMGLQFENLVVNNYADLVPFLHIGGAVVKSAAPFRNARTDASGEKGRCQIDLLVQTPRAYFVVEIKRKNEIRRDVEDEVARKIERLPMPRGVSARPVLVYDGHLASVVEGDNYFDALVPARKLLGL